MPGMFAYISQRSHVIPTHRNTNKLAEIGPIDRFTDRNTSHFLDKLKFSPHVFSHCLHFRLPGRLPYRQFSDIKFSQF